MDLFLIDALGPFFQAVEGRRINWSKAPFASMPLGAPVDGPERRAYFARVAADLDRFCAKVVEAGFNAVTIDDVVHLARHPAYEPEAAAEIESFRVEFPPLLEIVRRHGLRLYLTMDVMSFSPALRERVGTGVDRVAAFARELLGGLLSDFAEIDGVILRVGESDGLDVGGLFRSELVVREPRDVRKLLGELLPLFESLGRDLVFRTWTVGAHSVGDLIWHRDTLRESFEGIASGRLIVSMKYGESDFFRYLPLNRSFFRSDHRKIIELQARREYEGCGEFPAPVGVDYERYARELEAAPNVVGVSVWVQTGGWVPFRRRAYLEPEGVWNEINAEVTLRIFRHRESVEAAAAGVAASRGIRDTLAFLELLRLSEDVVKHLLYIEEFARQKLFFRRVRVPPQLAVYWNNIFVVHPVKKVLRHFVRSPGSALRQGRAAFGKLGRIAELTRRCGLPEGDIDFMRDTFEVVAMAREYYFKPFDEELANRVRAVKLRYQERYPRGSRPRYRVQLEFKPFRLRRRTVGLLIALFTRRKRGYRTIDRVLSLGLLSWIYRFVRRAKPSIVPKFARESAMGIDPVFK